MEPQLELAPSPTRRTLCDIAGGTAVCLSTLLAVVGLCSLDLLRNGLVVWLVASAVLAGASLYLWYAGPKAKRMKSREWLAGLVFTPVLGAICFAIDVFAGSSTGHYDNFIQAALHAGSPFGIVLTIAICPVGTILFFAGWVRAELRERLMPSAESEDEEPTP
jgi:hypothetical protein